MLASCSLSGIHCYTIIVDQRLIETLGLGVFVVFQNEADDFLKKHPVEALWGVGRVTLKKLKGLGINSVGDLAAAPRELLVRELGASHGHHLSSLSQGIDVREVDSDRERKSISHEETFASDVYERDVLVSEIIRLSDAVSSRAREQGVAGRTVHLKVRQPDMSYVTRSVTLEGAVDTLPEIAGKATDLLTQLDLQQGVRLLGVGLSRLVSPGPEQLTFSGVEGTNPGWGKLSVAMDRIRQKYGSSAIGPGFPR